MALKKEEKDSIISKFRKNEKDTGTVEVQVALLTREIEVLTEHMKQHKHDYHSKLGLLKKVGRRRSLLNYLKKEDTNRYREIIKKLNIRK
jgi:small subunit ribosomal protein S15